MYLTIKQKRACILLKKHVCILSKCSTLLVRILMYKASKSDSWETVSLSDYTKNKTQSHISPFINKFILLIVQTKQQNLQKSLNGH